MIRVLVVEDSPVVQEFLVQILRSEPDIEVVGIAATGEEALEAVERVRPDVVTMDIHMPKMNGFDATRRIMETRPTPIVIVSGATDVNSAAAAFQAMQAGALAVLPRPAGVTHPDHNKSAAELVSTVKLMSEVKVIRRWPTVVQRASQPATIPVRPKLPNTRIQIVAMGASTGGPPVLQSILSQIPKQLSVPIVVVQHMAEGFIQGFATWLEQVCALPVQIGRQGMDLLPGHVYLAPDGAHMLIGSEGRLALSKNEPKSVICPSVSRLFRSVAEVYKKNAVGILLTGMGKDGAEELKLMRQAGAVTIAQNAMTSIVYGMPGEACRIGAADYELSPEEIGTVLSGMLSSVAKRGLGDTRMETKL